jgi:hypothetical protein
LWNRDSSRALSALLHIWFPLFLPSAQLLL